MSPEQQLAARLGRLMIWASLAGVLISAVAVAWLAMAGQAVHPWPLSLYGWWSAPGPRVLRVLAGSGILLLAATPVIMLAVFGVQAFRQGRKSTVLVALGIAAVLSTGLWLALSGGP